MNLAKAHNGKHWNAKSTTLNGKQATEFHVGFVNYLTPENNWAEIDCIVKESGSVFEVTKAPFECTMPLYADGEAFFNNNNRFDVFKKTLINCAPLGVTMVALNASHIQGQVFDINGDGRLDAVRYPSGLPALNADLAYYVHHGKAPRLQHLGMWPVPFYPSSDMPLEVYMEFTDGVSNDIEISPRIIPDRITGQNRRMRWRDENRTKLNNNETVSQDKGFYIRAKDEEQKRGIGIKEVKIWDSGGGNNKKVWTINATIKKSGTGYILTKHIPKDFFTGAVFPVYTDATTTFYSDPDPETNESVDGWMERQAEGAWTTLATGNGTSFSDTAQSLSVRWWESSAANIWEFLDRSGIVFNTSSISGTITDAILSVHGNGKADLIGRAADFALNITEFAPASNTALANSDYQTALNTSFSSDITFNNVDEAGYNDFTLDANGIATIGATAPFMIRATKDISDIAPGHSGANNQINTFFYAADRAGTTEDPKLVVVQGQGQVLGMLRLGRLGAR